MGKFIYGNNSILKNKDSVFLEDVAVKDIVRKFGTPLFAFMKNRIVDNIAQFHKSISEVFKNWNFFYSVKANYLEEILSIINSCGVPFEIISEFEYDLLKKNNFNTKALLIGGPYLPESLILKTIEDPDSLFVVYTIENCRKLQKIAALKNIDKVNMILRIISPKKDSHLGFKINKLRILEFGEEIMKFDRLNIIGLLSHYGTQMNTLEKYLINANYLSDMAVILEDFGLLTPKIFNFGGGFPIACSYKDKLLTNTFQNILNAVKDKGYDNITYYFEPGRNIVGDAGVGLMKIISIAHNKESFFLNAGGNIFPRFTKNPLRFYDIDKPIKNYNYPVNIYGIVLSDSDILAKKYNFTNFFSLNDTVMITNCGAYSLTFSNRFPYYFPEIILIDRNNHKKISLQSL